MKKIISLAKASLVIISLAFVSTSCMNCIDGDGPMTSENRQLDSFSKLEVNIGADVTIHPGDELQITINAQKNLMDIIEIRTKGSTLVIGSSQCIRSRDGIKVDLTVPTISSIKLNGSGSIRTKSIFKTDELEADINGSGTLAIDVNSKYLEVNINGSGEVIFNGSTDNLDIVINGSGDYRGLGLQTNKAEVTIRGSGDIHVYAKKSLEAEILGSGDVIYAGNPSVESTVKGSGNITKKE